MNQLDIYYRALIDYRKQTLHFRECEAQRAAISRANEEQDKIQIQRTVCTVEEDWIDAIEKGLVFVEKAINEERQFIRSNGEVEPIEKVKRVSKESVEHLARHSNLITKKAEGPDLIPDQLYNVEKLTDYTIYENRFLYMLLCYLRDFVSLRYEQILDLTTTYNGCIRMNKTVTFRKQKLVYEMTLQEERKDDWYLREHNEAKDAISRIDLIFKAILHYLATPLMEEVAKAPKLKPPITKTNVLKMNKNFKGAVALYEYITAYDKLGYTAETQTKTLAPFSDFIADELAETVALTSFLTYEHGLGIEDFLKDSYEEEEKRRKAEEAKKLAEQIKSLQRRIKESGVSVEEYMLMLEKRNRALESDSAQLVLAKEEIERLNAEKDELTAKVVELTQKSETLQQYLEALSRKYTEDMEAQRMEFQAQIATLHETYTQTIFQMTETHKQELAAAEEEKLMALAELESKMQSIVDARIAEAEATLAEKEALLKEAYDAKHAELQETLATMQAAIQEERLAGETWLRNEKAALTEERGAFLLVKQEQDKKMQDMQEEFEWMDQRKTLAEGRLNALRKECGLLTEKDDFTSQKAFNELERQYDIFKLLFRKEWKKTKAAIRKEVWYNFFHRKEKLKKELLPTTDDSAEKAVTAQTPEVQAETPITEKTNLPTVETQTLETATAETQTATATQTATETQVVTETTQSETEGLENAENAIQQETEHADEVEKTETNAVAETLVQENVTVDEKSNDNESE